MEEQIPRLHDSCSILHTYFLYSSCCLQITSFSMSKTLSCLAVSGPTHDQQPVFQWSTSPFSNVTHLGMPDRWDFDAVTIHWEG